jgi:dihydrofolate synthase/folylpolyglutamate synthase
MSGEIHSLQDAAAWLEGLINVERRPDWPYARLGLGPIERLLARLGNPQAGLPILHVAGSKGKGSTALLAEAVLLAAGERVGVFTSPHLESWTERFRIDAVPVDGVALAAAVETLRPHVEAMREENPQDAPTFFDATVAAGLLLFRDSGLDRVILEVGLGGRMDSTNAVTPQVCAVTTIELEHTDRLGETLAEIAGEKAGILKPGVPVVSGVLPQEAADVVAAAARRQSAPLTVLNFDGGFSYTSETEPAVAPDGQVGIRVRVVDAGIDAEFALPVLGAHQAHNAAVALGCVNRLPGAARGAALVEAAVKGFAEVRLPGRIEVVGRAPWRIVDGAHTAKSAQALAEALTRFPRRRARLVLSVSAGKDLQAILAALAPGFDEITVTRAEPTRSLTPADVSATLRNLAPDATVHAVPNPHLALGAALEGVGPEDLVCAAGSVYLAGIARRVLA